MDKKIIYILICVLSLLIVFLVGFMKICIKNGGFIFENGNYDDLIKEETYSLEEIDEIELDLRASDVEFFESENNELKVIQYGNKKTKEFNDSVNSKSINIVDKNKNNFVILSFNHGSKYKIYLPANYSGTIDIETISGDVDINHFDLNLTDLKINTTSGDIILNSIFKLNLFEAKTVSGNIEVDEINASKVTLKTTSGDIESERIEDAGIEISTISGDVSLGRISNKINVRTTSGEIDINKIKISGDSKISTVSGNVDIEIDNESDCIINTDTTSGRVNIRKNTFGSKEYDLKINTVSGDIGID